MLNLVEIFSTFIVMFAIIDITGSIPIFVSMREQGKTIRPLTAAVVALALFVGFFFAGDALLRLFSIDTASFAVAGSFVLFLLALEMIMGREFIRNDLIFVIRKFFGVILLAIAVKLFVNNIAVVIQSIPA